MKILQVYVTKVDFKAPYIFYDFVYNNLWMEMTYTPGNSLSTLRIHSSSNNSDKLLESYLKKKGTIPKDATI